MSQGATPRLQAGGGQGPVAGGDNGRRTWDACPVRRIKTRVAH